MQPGATKPLVALTCLLAGWCPCVTLGQVFDHDADGDVDHVDYADFSSCMEGPTIAAAAACAAHHDADDDGDVDLMDYRAFNAAFTGTLQIGTVELAGHPLAAYPYFTHVQVFHEDESVSVAIDPTCQPDLVDHAGDLYIVAHRTANDWVANPTLVDVRGNGPQTIMCTGSTVQDCTYVVAEGYELSSDAGTGLGVGYDIVFDVDQDGALGGGDVIDGGTDVAGLYVLGDMTAPGPLAVSNTTYSGGTWLGQKTFYPTDIAAMGQLPLIVISHGNGHEYTWYDYLQAHLASYGYIVMSHTNETGPGIETASVTTLTNTDYFIANHTTLHGGVFAGHLDASRIVWIGHSRGGEGVARAYDRLHDGTYSPSHFGIEDIVLVSSIAPTDFLGTNSANPHDVPYHLIYGSADGDVSGTAESDIAQSFHLHERATGFKQSTYVHGADHNDFNCCGFDDFTGPASTEIGRPEAQQVAKAVFLAVVKRYVENNVPAEETFWRQWETCRPVGVAEDTIVVSQYHAGPEAGGSIIDDYQSQTSLEVSSSGGSVTYNVQNIREDELNDANSNFAWTSSDPMNGMTYGGAGDTAAGAVFDFRAGRQQFMEFEVSPSHRDFSDDDFLSFRACQGTRHFRTIAELANLTFSVTLRDSAQATSTINLGVYGGGIEEPYQRSDFSAGVGWQNEFETIRIRLTDFTRNGTGLDLSDIEAIRLDFGSDFGSAQGRLGFDDLEVTKQHVPGGTPTSLTDGEQDLVIEADGDDSTIYRRACN